MIRSTRLLPFVAASFGLLVGCAAPGDDPGADVAATEDSGVGAETGAPMDVTTSADTLAPADAPATDTTRPTDATTPRDAARADGPVTPLYFMAYLFTNAVSPECTMAASTSNGRGTMAFNPATNVLGWEVTHRVPSPTSAHIHTGASGTNGPMVYTFPSVTSPINGSTTLTSDQVMDLLAGRLYIDIHSTACPNGEVRGQIESSR
jgi:hypothetical protein